MRTQCNPFHIKAKCHIYPSWQSGMFYNDLHGVSETWLAMNQRPLGNFLYHHK